MSASIFDGKQVRVGSLPVDRVDTIGYTPSANQDLATVNYVDVLMQGLTPKLNCQVSTIANIANIATITITTLDNYTLLDGDRILVQNQINLIENGVYTWASGTQQLTRALDFDDTPGNEVVTGVFLYVENGDTWEGYGFFVSGTPSQGNDVIIGTDDVVFSVFSKHTVYTAGDGINILGTQLSVDAGNGLEFVGGVLQLGGVVTNNLNFTTQLGSEVNFGTTSNEFSVFSVVSDVISFSSVQIVSLITDIRSSININSHNSITIQSIGLIGFEYVNSIDIGQNGIILTSSGNTNLPSLDMSGSFAFLQPDSLTDKNYQDTRLGGQAVDALITTPTATEDGFVISWNDTNSEYELIVGGGGTLTDGNGTTANGTAVDLGGTFNSNITISSSTDNNFNISSGGFTNSIDISGIYNIDSRANIGMNYTDTMSGNIATINIQYEDVDSPVIELIARTSSFSIYSFITVSLNGIDINARYLTNIDTRLFFNQTGIRIIGDDPLFQGMTYNADYSADYTTRSLVDKAYVDGLIFTLTNGNGTTANGTAVDLGGTMSADVSILTGGNIFIAGESSNGQMVVDNTNGEVLFRYGSINNEARFYARSGVLSVQVGTNNGDHKIITLDRGSGQGIRIKDSEESIGMTYDADYSLSATARWINDKGYTDTRLGGQNVDALVTTPTATEDGFVVSWNDTNSEYELVAGVTKVGTPVDNQIGVWAGDGTLEGDPNLIWGGVSLNIGGVQIAHATNTINGVGTLSLTSSATVRIESNWQFNAGILNSVITNGSLSIIRNGTGSLTFASATIDNSNNWDFNSNKLTSVADPTAPQDVTTKNYVDNLIQSTEVIITSAQVLTLNTIPITIIPAPGVGNMLEIISISLMLDYNTTAYLVNDDIRFLLGTTVGSLSVMANFLAETSIVQTQVGPNFISYADNRNQGLTIDVVNGDPTTGDSDLKVSVLYKIVDFN